MHPIIIIIIIIIIISETLPSYNYKNILLNMMQKDEENAKHGSVVREWTPDKIGDRFRDFAKVLFSRAGQISRSIPNK